jgi:hypothetical protein
MKTIRVILIIVIVLAIAAGVYFFIQNRSQTAATGGNGGATLDNRSAVHQSQTAIPAAAQPKPAALAPAAKGVTFRIEKNVNRQASDYRDFEMDSGAGLEICQKACETETTCRAFTYVKAGPRGAKPHCWLKNTVPMAYTDDQCITGVKE